MWIDSPYRYLHSNLFLPEVERQNIVWKLLSFCVKSLVSYLHCACFILFSISTACACRENLCILFYFFKIMLTFCENFMKILLYKLWHLFFFLLCEALNITFWTRSDGGYTNSKLLIPMHCFFQCHCTMLFVWFVLPSPLNTIMWSPLSVEASSSVIPRSSFLEAKSIQSSVLWSSVTRDAFSVQVP